MRAAATLLVMSLVVLGCSAQEPPSPPESRRSDASVTPLPVPTPTPTQQPESGTTRAPVRTGNIDVSTALAAVDYLAGEVGPRHGTSAAYQEAVGWVAGEMSDLGFDVRRQRFDVPGGNSWGVPVPAGTSVNVVATPVGLDPRRPHLVVGAHLDTVPQAPGAEDNGSGVGVLLAAAEATSRTQTRLPVVWVAFGAEEPRGPGDNDHHYGSRAYVDALNAGERGAVRGMVSLDRVGVGATVPIGSAGESDPLQRILLSAARASGTPATPDPFQRSSDHWSFVRAGLPGARLGGTPYAAYHSAGDLPGVVDRAQLRRTGRILLAWLAPTR